jgi:anti-sigma regulatory factor (Ser/Thr protein kinase)
MIIITDEATPEDVIGSLRENVFSYFRTPFSSDYFVQMVRLAMIQEEWDDGIEVIAATRNWIRLLARCTNETACRLVSFIRQSNLPDAERADLAAATHEILVNAMEHGAKFNSNQYVEVAYLRTKRAVACRVKDPGEGFAIEELRHAAINNTSGDLFSHISARQQLGMRDGGFGILIAKKLVDEVIYGEHGNDVVLIKYLDSPAPAVSPTFEPADA